MAKRFIDTALFDDPWFFDLSKDAKLLWIYLITKCNHAGIFEANRKLIEFQAGIKSFDTVLNELNSRIITLNGGKFFIPKFIHYQYPAGLSPKSPAQKSVIDLLSKYNINLNSIDTVSEQYQKSINTLQDKDKDKEIDKDREIEKESGIIEVEILEPYSFDEFWELYDLKKGSKDKLRKKWDKISQEDRVKIFQHIPLYKQEQPDKQFRKHPETYINNRSWEDELIPRNNGRKSINNPKNTIREISDLVDAAFGSDTGKSQQPGSAN